MKKNKVYFLVTGCCGFIGSHMCELLLKKNHYVIGVDSLVSGKVKNIENFKKKKNFIFFKTSIENIENKIKAYKIKYVFHFAGHGELIPSVDRPLQYFHNNSYLTALLIDIFKNKKFKLKKFVYAASSSCYGLQKGSVNENAKIDLQHPYAFSKYIGEQAVIHWSKVYQIPYISLRIFNAYGPRSRTSNVYGAVMGVFLKQKLANKPLTIVGKGNQKRDFLYIGDLCDAFYKAALSHKKNIIFNLGYGQSRSIKELANFISKKKVNIPWRPGESYDIQANISKITKILKWKPKINLETGIQIVLKNINYWKKAPLWTKKNISVATKNWLNLLGSNKK